MAGGGIPRHEREMYAFLHKLFDWLRNVFDNDEQLELCDNAVGGATSHYFASESLPAADLRGCVYTCVRSRREGYIEDGQGPLGPGGMEGMLRATQSVLS